MITERIEFTRPNKVYCPLTDSQYKLANVKVSVNDTVKIGDVLAYKFRGKEKLPVIATVSGTVVEFKEMMDRNGKLVDHCVIENDFENQSIELTALEGPKALEIRSRLQEVGLESLDQDGSYTALKFDHHIQAVFVNTIFVNEPQYTFDYAELKDNAKAIAQGIDAIATAALCDNVYVFVDKHMEKEVLEELGVECVDKNIQFVTIDPRKQNGGILTFIKKTLKTPLATNLLAIGGMYVSSETALYVSQALNGQVPNKRLVALTGDGVKKNALVEVVSGTLLSEVVEYVEGYNEVEEMTCHIGDFLTGTQVTTDEIAVTLNVDAINFSEFDETEEDVCIKCGACNDVCPAGILPQNIMDAELRSVNERIVELNTFECVECGLCSYVCPSKINVLEWVRRARRRVG
jgi:electron transport complex protein RnfC